MANSYVSLPEGRAVPKKVLRGAIPWCIEFAEFSLGISSQMVWEGDGKHVEHVETEKPIPHVSGRWFGTSILFSH